MYAGGHSEMEELNALQQRLQFDDPINIQFTSVRTRCLVHFVLYRLLNNWDLDLIGKDFKSANLSIKNVFYDFS